MKNPSLELIEDANQQFLKNPPIIEEPVPLQAACREDSLRFLRLLHFSVINSGDGWNQICTLTPHVKRAAPFRVGWLANMKHGSIELETQQTIGELSNLDEKNVYVHGTLFAREKIKGKSRGGDDEVTKALAITLDIDIAEWKEGHNKHRDGHSNYPKYDEVRAYFLGPDCRLRPTIMVNTGGGLQAWWVLLDPAEKAIASTLSRMILNSITRATGWSLDGMSPPSKMMRLPGTYNNNYKATGARPVKLIWAIDEFLYAADTIQEILGDNAPGTNLPKASFNAAPAAKPSQKYVISKGQLEALGSIGLQIASRKMSHPKFALVWDRRTKPPRGGSNSDWDWVMLNRAVDADVTDAESLLGLLIAYRTKFRATKKQPRTYITTVKNIQILRKIPVTEIVIEDPHWVAGRCTEVDVKFGILQEFEERKVSWEEFTVQIASEHLEFLRKVAKTYQNRKVSIGVLVSRILESYLDGIQQRFKALREVPPERSKVGRPGADSLVRDLENKRRTTLRISKAVFDKLKRYEALSGDAKSIIVAEAIGEFQELNPNNLPEVPGRAAA